MRGMPQFDCAPQTESSIAKGSYGFGTRDGSWDHPNQRAKTTPDLRIMLGGECVGQTGAGRPDGEIRPRRYAIQQDKPSALKVNPLQQCLVLFGFNFELT